MNQFNQSFTSRGFSLIEALVAVAISSVLLVGVLLLMVNTQKTGLAQQMYSQVQENGRASLDRISYDLRMAGNRGMTYTLSPMLKTSVIGLQPSVSGNCFTTSGQALDWARALLISTMGSRTPAIMGEDNLSSTGPQVFSGCISATDAQDGSDIVSVHYLDVRPLAGSDLVGGNIYVHSGIGGAVMFSCPTDIGGDSCVSLLADKREDPSGTAFFRLVSRAYYVRTWALTSGDGIPTLVQVDLMGDGSVATTPIVEGIHSLQLRYGVDNDDNGFVDQFKTAAQMPALSSLAGLSTDWNKIKAVKVDVLAVSLDTDSRRGSGTASYTVGGQATTLPERYMARAFSSTVSTRNARTQGG